MRNARLLHYSHCVSDIERSRRFYTDVLGFEVVAEFDFDDAATAQVMDAIGFTAPAPDRIAVLPGGIACCVVHDPDGFPIELVEMPALTLLPYESEG